MKTKIAVFMDIDGVLSMPWEGMPRDAWQKWGNGYAAPIPMWQSLIAAMHADKRLACHWLTNWGDDAWYWNQAAGTLCWPSLARPNAWTRRALPDCFEPGPGNVPICRYHWKLVALRYRLMRYHTRYSKVVWIEDGFTPETIAHASQEGWQLVDTTKHAICEFLFRSEGTMSNARAFIEQYIVGNGGE